MELTDFIQHKELLCTLCIVLWAVGVVAVLLFFKAGADAEKDFYKVRGKYDE